MRRHGSRRGFSFAFFVALVAFESSALAQWSPGHAAAVARFEEGTRLVEQGNCAAAIPKFVESLASEEGVGAHLNLADCYARTGATAEAWSEFKAAERFATLRRNDERREVAHNGAYALERKLLRLTLTIPFVDGLEVRINGVVIERDLLASRQVAIAPGPYVLEAKASKKKTVTKEGSGQAGDVQAVEIAFDDDPSATPAPAASSPPVPAPSPSSTQTTVAVIAGVAGLAAIAAGSVFGVIAIEDQSKLKSAFEVNPNCSGGYPGGACHDAAKSELDPREERAFTASTLSTVFFVAGGVALAGGALLFFTAPSRRSTGKSAAPQISAAARAILLGTTW